MITPADLHLLLNHDTLSDHLLHEEQKSLRRMFLMEGLDLGLTSPAVTDLLSQHKGGQR